MDDIWQLVFERLSRTDRGNVRLVCRHWFDLCRIFWPDEAFVFSHCLTSKKVFNVLEASRRDILNFKFFKLQIREDYARVWRRFGDRIASLEFDRCTFDAGTLELTFRGCPELRRLILRNCASNNHLTFGDELRDIAQRDFVNPNLSTFHLDFPFRRADCRPSDVQNVLAMFPHVEHLRLCVNGGHAPADRVRSFYSCLAVLRDSAARLKTLNVHLLEASGAGVRRSDVTIDLVDVENYLSDSLEDFFLTMSLNTSLNAFHLPPAPRCNFCTTLHFNFGGNSHVNFYATLVRLLAECRHLRDLKADLNGAPKRTFIDVLVALLKSSLGILTVRREDRCAAYEDADRHLKLLEISNRTVRELTVHNRDAHRNALLFLEYFREVRRLRVTEAREIVHHIVTLQPNLKSLDADIDVNMSPENQSTNVQLEKLEYLRIPARRFREIFSNTNFPNLKYLSLLRFFSGESTCTFEQLMAEVNKNAPNVRGVFVHLNFEGNRDTSWHLDNLAGRAVFPPERVRKELRFYLTKIIDICLKCVSSLEQIQYTWITVSMPQSTGPLEVIPLGRPMVQNLKTADSTLRGIFFKFPQLEAFAITDRITREPQYWQRRDFSPKLFEQEIYKFWISGR